MTGFLLKQQCPQRLLPADFNRRQDGSRPVLHDSADAPETDATAIAVLAAAALAVGAARRRPRPSPRRRRGCVASRRPTAPGAVARHRGLERQQHRAGRLGAGRHRWLASRPRSGCAPTRSRRWTAATSSAPIAGAIAYDDAALAAGRDDGHHRRVQRPVAPGHRPGRCRRWRTSPRRDVRAAHADRAPGFRKAGSAPRSPPRASPEAQLCLTGPGPRVRRTDRRHRGRDVHAPGRHRPTASTPSGRRTATPTRPRSRCSARRP